jgi:hypothetical protein
MTDDVFVEKTTLAVIVLTWEVNGKEDIAKEDPS